MLNSIIASKLWTISQLTALEGAGAKFKALAFSKGAKIVGAMTSPIESASLDGIAGIGPSLKQVIGELVSSKGETCKRLKELAHEHPPEVLELTSVSGIGAIKAYKLYREHKIKGLDQLLKALESGKIKDEKLKSAVVDAISKRDSGMDRLPISWVYPSVDAICRTLKEIDGVLRAKPAGSVRRFKDDVGDCDILVCVSSPKAKARVFKRFMSLADEEGDKMVMGEHKARIRIPIYGFPFQIDLLVVPQKEWGSALLYFTGAKDLNVEMRKKAIKKGWKLSEHGLFNKKGKRIASETEEEIFAKLGMAWIPPELRDLHVEAPRQLIERSDIDTDLHTHTTWSDGLSSPEEMIKAAIRLELRRIAITDHSYRIRKNFAAYVRAIGKLKARYSGDIDVLVGSEVDIKKDGSLALTPDQMDKLDFVVASIHHNHSENVEERLIKAASSKYVDLIGHPTGRLIPKRGIPECDWDRVFQVCAKHKVGLEINPNGDRLDLPSDLVILAKKRGCKFSINTDAHSADRLGRIIFGIKIARRAGLTPKDLMKGEVK